MSRLQQNRRQVPREAVGFAKVGVIGFVVDAALLTILVSLAGWDLYGSRLVSFACAVSVTWYLNRRWTFAHRASADRGREYSRYFGVQIIGALINLGVYSTALALFTPMAAYPVIPLALGSGVAMCFNFIASRHLAFQPEGPAIESTK